MWVNLSVRGVGAWAPLPLGPNLPPNTVGQPISQPVKLWRGSLPGTVNYVP
jgi:hypothetical protein